MLNRGECKIKIRLDAKVCIHSGNCVKNLPSVFQVKEGKFVVISDGAPED